MLIVQCLIPKPAASAVQVNGLRFRARERGLTPDWVEVSYTKANHACRVTCRRPIAELLAEELSAAVASATDQLTRDACERGLIAVREAIIDSQRPTVPIGPGGNGG